MHFPSMDATPIMLAASRKRIPPSPALQDRASLPQL